MISHPKQQAIAILLLAFSAIEAADAFAPSLESRQVPSTYLAAEGFAPAAVQERPPAKKTEVNGESSVDPNMSADEAKSALIDLVPRMTGQDEEYRAVEFYVNMLENKYAPVQTIDFLNLAMAGDWQLLFSTNLMGRPNRKLRLRELVQKIEPDRFGGSVTNSAQWDYAEDGMTFDATGQFAVKCSYAINQGARMVVELDEHEVRPAKGSKIPRDVPELVGLLHRAIPKEIFDPNGHAMDTTYLDADLRIARLTGPNHEGVRNIFMRKGSLEISPL
eukprot:CAMPEP_0172531936 /NCGR_PEP_ID=MMETSP1067-20121228/5153_1 /TAXON_ID=265564 ORGANISM="Thalassiosira punctigera, Strain Tpunct2005C2" /NCGR_SAMPLE_ID=MMETSP1067 /ASSEMBLY_ACC=CAM_ASM_000444 /LENGTH=275 /DNA_ID=CAMNT_0013316379 /DNA_START=27 /DNA_END=854 /DNA_ORIENTATION=+